MTSPIEGFSRLSREQQIDLVIAQTKLSDKEVESLLSDTISIDHISRLSENVISTFSLPYSVVSNFLINGKKIIVPMVTEESSVVAAAGKAAKFWFLRGGFNSKVISRNKVGTIYLRCNNNIDQLKEKIISSAREYITNITQSMQNRGGGLIDVKIESLLELDNIHKLIFIFDTVDSMGANFINTTLEKTKHHLSSIFQEVDFLIAILSNHSPDCIVESEVSCSIEDLTYSNSASPQGFAERFKLLVDIANTDLDRAATHNKGIMNGIDSILIATGNDFRAVESGLSSYLKDRNILTPSKVSLSEGKFRYYLKMPIVLGTKGGITECHQKAIISNKILNNPPSSELMEVVCSVGLASNFAAISALITTGIQKGHMKLHNKKWDGRDSLRKNLD